MHQQTLKLPVVMTGLPILNSSSFYVVTVRPYMPITKTIIEIVSNTCRYFCNTKRNAHAETNL